MAFALVNGQLIEVTVVCSCQQQLAENKFVFLVSDVIGIPTAADLANAIDGFTQDDLRDAMSQNAFYRGVTVRKVFPVVSPAPATFPFPNLRAGSEAFPPLASQVCGLIRWLTDIRTTGRTFVPFPATSAADTLASPLVAYLDKLDIWANHLRSPIIVSGALGSCTIQLGINSVPQGFQVVTGHVSVDGWATQIRRSQFRRGNSFPV